VLTATRWQRVAIAAVGLGLVAPVGACSSGGIHRDSNGRITEKGKLSVYDLRAGDCLNPPDRVDNELVMVDVLPCADRHTQEVVAVKTIDSKDYPGDDEVRKTAEQLCVKPFGDYIGVDYVDSGLYLTYLLPSLRSWDDGDKDVTCIAQVVDADGVKGTLKGSER
jgi:hypothetical protein